MNTQKLLHDIDMKMNGSTTIKMDQAFTIGDLIKHTAYRLHRPFRKQFGIGICESCGKLKTDLQYEAYDADYEPDEEDPSMGHCIAIKGMICESCSNNYENYCEDQGRYI